MTVNFEKTGDSIGELTFTIDREIVEKGLDKTFNSVKGSLNVPGFRKGRVPRRIFNQMYGEEALYEDTLNDIFPSAYSEALEEVEADELSDESEEEIKDVVVDQAAADFMAKYYSQKAALEKSLADTEAGLSSKNCTGKKFYFQKSNKGFKVFIGASATEAAKDSDGVEFSTTPASN